jgi:hypothetical protein
LFLFFVTFFSPWADIALQLHPFVLSFLSVVHWTNSVQSCFCCFCRTGVTPLDKVIKDIEKVEQAIKKTEEKLERETNGEEKKYLRDKEKQLRDEKKQLRDEKILLLQQQRTQSGSGFWICCLLSLVSCLLPVSLSLFLVWSALVAGLVGCWSW